MIDRNIYLLQCSTNLSCQQMLLHEALSRLHEKFQAFRQQLGPANITVDNISGIEVISECLPYEEEDAIIVEGDCAEEYSV